ncbi:MAG: hypothetical protein KAS30_04485, partial [Candidatus Diapherotrites archaeon]|nr:hypothetical protein [Candidatus Diapherotrites archaeon]
MTNSIGEQMLEIEDFLTKNFSNGHELIEYLHDEHWCEESILHILSQLYSGGPIKHLFHLKNKIFPSYLQDNDANLFASTNLTLAAMEVWNFFLIGNLMNLINKIQTKEINDHYELINEFHNFMVKLLTTNKMTAFSEIGVIIHCPQKWDSIVRIKLTNHHFIENQVNPLNKDLYSEIKAVLNVGGNQIPISKDNPERDYFNPELDYLLSNCQGKLVIILPDKQEEYDYEPLIEILLENECMISAPTWLCKKFTKKIFNQRTTAVKKLSDKMGWTTN